MKWKFNLEPTIEAPPQINAEQSDLTQFREEFAISCRRVMPSGGARTSAGEMYPIPAVGTAPARMIRQKGIHG